MDSRLNTAAARRPSPVTRSKGLRPCYLPLVLLLALGGCALQQPVTDPLLPGNWEERQQQLGQLHSWKLAGRIAVQLDKDAGSATLQWHQQRDNYVIRLIGPLGKGNFELQGSPGGVSMRDSDNRLQFASDPESLLEAQFGWQVPLSGLHWWIRGLPDPAEKIDNLQLDEQASIAELSQAGWQVSYGRYRLQQGLRLPEKIHLSNTHLKVKLQIKKWELLP